LAFAYIQQKQNLFLFLTHGFSGSGKTRGSQVVVSCFNAIRLRSDVVRKHLFIEKEIKTNMNIYSEEATKQTYSFMLELTQIILEQAQLFVILDATFLRRWQRELIMKHVWTVSVRIFILHFQAKQEILEERIIKRENDASEATIEVLKQQIQTQDLFDEKNELPFVLTFETDKITEKMDSLIAKTILNKMTNKI
jgi:predicted kinase